MNLSTTQVPNQLKNNQLLNQLANISEKIHFRAIESKTGLVQSFHAVYNQVSLELKRLNNSGYCIYATINKTDGLGVKNENITAIRALFLDFDDCTVNNKLIIETLPVKPSLVIETSSNKYHAYFILDSPDSRIELFSTLQKQLAQKYNSDKNVCDLPRIMRLPDFYHLKDKSNPFTTKVIIDNDIKYNLDFLIKNFQLSQTLETKNEILITSNTQGEYCDSSWNRKALVNFVRAAKKENIPTSGTNGNDRLTKYFAAMGHDYGLPLEVTQEVLWEHLNPLCIPPWEEKNQTQFYSFIADGYNLCRSPIGCKSVGIITEKVPEPPCGWAENRKLAPKIYSNHAESICNSIAIDNTNDIKKGLKQFTLNGVSKYMKQQMLDTKFVLKDIAVLGQLTVLYAAPNTGKTLITIKLLIEAVKSGVIEGKDISYINADDSFNAAVYKLNIFEKHEIGMILPDVVKADYLEGSPQNNIPRFKTSKLTEYIESMIENNEAKNEIIILDTLKKFTDLMDKKGSSEFSKVLRRFSTSGGTVIALAHVNKQSDSNGRKVHAGTTDILDDFDCSYLIEIDGETDSEKRVKFINNKARGNVKKEVCFTYSIEDGNNYEDLLNSVKCVEAPTVITVKNHSKMIIDKAHDLIANEVNKKTELINALHSTFKPHFSKSKITKILEVNEGEEWLIDVGKNNSNLFHSLTSS